MPVPNGVGRRPAAVLFMAFGQVELASGLLPERISPEGRSTWISPERADLLNGNIQFRRRRYTGKPSVGEASPRHRHRYRYRFSIPIPIATPIAIPM